MAQIISYVNYVIYFQDEAEYNFATGLVGGNLIQLAPRAAATLFGIPFPYPTGEMSLNPKGIYFIFPDFPGAMINYPLASGITVDDTVDSQLIPGQAGVPASIFPAGPDNLRIWSGTIIRSRGAGISLDPPVTAIAQRRFAIGFEWSELMLEGSGTSTFSASSRDASRTIDGKGFAIRGDNYPFINVTTNVLRTALAPSTTWERFYIRTRRLPSGAASCRFWRTIGNLSPSAGAGLRYHASGEIKLYSISTLGVETDKGVVFTPVTNQWYKVDVLVKYATGFGTDGRCSVYVDGVFKLSFIDSTSNGLNASNVHVSTDFGRTDATDTNSEMELDLDDWISSDLPSNIDPLLLTFAPDTEGIDWLLGSHVRKTWVDSASLVNWAPNAFGNLNQGDNPLQQKTAELTSSTSAAQIVSLTDALLQSIQDTIANVLGVVAATIGAYSRNAAGTDGQLGYKLAGGAPVLTVINEVAANTSRVVGYLPSGMVTPAEISPWGTVYQKSSDGNLATVTAISSIVEYLGVWGPEDDPVFDYPVSRLTFIHNCNYFNTQYGFVGSQPTAPVSAVGGTYIGNGTTQSIVLPQACHFLWIRNTNGAGDGTVLWLSPVIGPTLTNDTRPFPGMRVFSDASGVYKFQVTGNDAVINRNTHTYQYIAFCDPGMRYNLCGVFNHDVNSSTPKVNPLINSAFLAQAGFVMPQVVASAGGVSNIVYKGLGMGANVAAPLDANPVKNNYMNFAAGILNTLGDAHFGSSANTTYSLWRTADSGSSGCGNVMVQLTSYVGNGVSPRVIPLTPASSRVPLFVMVVPANSSQGYFRDPSHAGANSSFITNNGLIATAITAVGVDQITVAGSLNSNGVTYSVFAICGAVAGMSNGAYSPTYCTPDTTSVLGGPYEEPNIISGDINVIGEGGLVLNGTVPLLLLKDISGIYTLVPDKLNDTLLDRQTGQTSVEVPILPVAKTGYIGG